MNQVQKNYREQLTKYQANNAIMNAEIEALDDSNEEFIERVIEIESKYNAIELTDNLRQSEQSLIEWLYEATKTQPSYTELLDDLRSEANINLSARQKLVRLAMQLKA